MKRMIGILIAACLLVSTAGCTGEAAASGVIANSESGSGSSSELSETSNDAQDESGSEDEKTMEELLDENQKLLDAMKPKKEEMIQYYSGKIPKEYQDKKWFNVDPSVADTDLFRVFIQIDLKADDAEAAKKLAISLYNTFTDAPYDVEMYDFMLVNGGAPIGMFSISPEDQKISSFIDGKSQSEPLEGAADTAGANGGSSDPAKTVYWISSGKTYHFSKDCATLKRADSVQSGTLQDALDAKKTDPCNVCAGG